MGRLRSPDQLQHFLRREVEEEFFQPAGEELVCHVALAGEHGVDVFLDGAAADERVDDDRVLLADAVDAVACLVFL